MFRMNAVESRHVLVTAFAVLLLTVPVPRIAADSTDWNYLPAVDIGAPAFHADHPTWDGRGVVVAILDTGVDARAPGLQRTAAGGIKLIDVRDFGTQGDWTTAAAELADGVYRTEDGLQLRGAERLAVPPAAGPDARPVWIGVVAEPDFLNSDAVHDLNDDGDTSDKFGFLVYQAERAAVEEALGVGAGYDLLQGLNETAAATVADERASARVWLVVVDTDGDGDLAGEQLLRDYHVNHDVFTLGSDNAPDSRALMAWELNVRTNEDHLGAMTAPTVEFHFDDGAHGSHCAGIAAGFEVSGQAGLHGVAPGAWVISLKIGDNRLSGGATRTSSMKKAYEYAAAFEERWGVPVVVNMSFGISSVEEGDDAMGRWLDELLAEHPTLYVCTSAGNEGPGLSTVGLPATSPSVISSGAYLSPTTGADLYNARLDRPTLFGFSSRGGEAAKPDVVAPGSAMSTVPGFVDGMARFNGTSMASPQTAGAIACLVSAARQEDLRIHWGMVKRALIAGGRPVAGLSVTDQGGGLVDLAGTWPVLSELAGSESAHAVLRYDIETACVFQDDGTSAAAYWRSPGGVPLPHENIDFTVTPVFHPDLGPDERDTFFRSFKFKSEADWLKVVSGDRYIRGDMGMTVRLRYDGKELEGPGARSARVVASLDGGDLDGLAAREFYLWNTVVTGTPVGADIGYTRIFLNEHVPQSWVTRHYVDVPAGATAMRVRLEVSEDVAASRGAAAYTEICSPEGHVHGDWAGYATVDDRPIADQVVLAPDLHPGTWEINVVTGIRNEDQTNYRLTVSFDGYEVRPAVVTAADGSITVIRAFSGTFRGEVDAMVEGFRREQKIEVKESDEWTLPFTLDATTPRASFHLLMDEAVANLFTDCAVKITDDKGEAVRATGFDALVADVDASLPPGSYELHVVGAFALAQDMADWGFDVEEKYYFASPVAGEVERAGGGRLILPCGVPTDLSVAFDVTWPAAPDEHQVFGTVRFRDTHTEDRRPGDDDGRLVLEVPIRLE